MERKMERADIAIIGTGPGGVSAALTAKVRNKNILLIGKKQMSDKVSKAHQIMNYPGLPAVTGADMAKAFEKQLAMMEINITDSRIGTVYAMGDYFAIQAGEEVLEAKSVILACGVVSGKTLPGEEEMLGRGVSYCATCDACFYKGKKVAVIGYGKDAEHEADFLAEVAAEVLYFPMYQDVPGVSEQVMVIKERPKEIFGEKKVEGLRTEQGEYLVDGVFVLRDAVSPKQLVPGLELDGNHVKVNLSMETNIPGLFACGDITGTPYQYIKAAGQGNVAALSAVAYLDAKKHEAGKQ